MKKILLGIPIISILFFFGCSKNNPTSPQSGNGEMKMYMVDSPANFDAVFVNVTEVDVQSATSDTSSGWYVINSTPHMYDLLSLRNGISAVLGDTMLPAGHYTQIRLILGAGNYVVINGSNYDLTVPSGSQTGIKLTNEFDIQANTTYQLTLDFDADKSIVQTGNGKFILKPTIRLVSTVTSGTISGAVLPITSKATIWTVANSDTVTAYADAITGYYKLMALPAGKYTVNIDASDTTMFRDTTITNVAVVSGQNTNAGTITLSTK
ncbi:MAG: DUF4382 domain-containing protein [Bacteroidetes bacterium]|nr:DUF4382 domain-containing protein [Bacteroidota bacterium]